MSELQPAYAHPKARRNWPALLISLLCFAASGYAGYQLWHMHGSPIPTLSDLPGNVSSSSFNSLDEPLGIAIDDLSLSAEAVMPAHDYKIPAIADGKAPVIRRLPTQEPVVFLGIDDGANKQAFELDVMRQNNVKASLFLANSFIHSNPDFFKDFVAAGSLIENHSVSHRLFTNLSYDEQVKEICGQADLEAQQFGRRPILFRPPGGAYNEDTQRAAATCGMKAVVLWIAKANGGSMQYQVGTKLRPGDIVLMHFRPEFKDDMQAFLDAAKASGLHTELLSEWTQ